MEQGYEWTDCPIKKAKTGYAQQAVDFIGQLYGIERQADEEQLSFEQRAVFRQKKVNPVLEQFHQWLKQVELKTPPKGLLGKAVGYTLKRWNQLTLYVNYGYVPLDTNLAENAIRPFVLGRKNWLFSDTVDGAKASAVLYSLIETARANDLNPFEYLKQLFEKFPHSETDDQIKLLLPQYHDASSPS